MSNRNYRNYQKGKEPVIEQVKEDKVLEPVEEDTSDDIVEMTEQEFVEEDTSDAVDKTVDQEPAKTEIGKVNCIRLKIRNKPSIGGSIVCLARVGDELTIDRSKYYDGWLKVTTVDGLEGFCKQDFVTII